MSHQRTIVRNALISKLVGTSPSYATNAQSRVYSHRVHNLPKGSFPVIYVSNEQETAEPRDLRTTSYIRTVTFKIDAFVEQNTNYDTSLDDLCLQIENVLASDRTVSGTATGVTYISTETTFDGSGEKVIGKATLTYEIKYLA